MLVDPSSLSRRDCSALILGLVAPRPIAWVSMLDQKGRRNLAPFSFFNAFSTSPPTLVIGPGSREGVNKDSLRNIRASGEFVVNVVSRELAVRANQTSAEFAPAVDEWGVAGLTAAQSDDVRPPRIDEAPAALECRVLQLIDLGPPEAATNSLVVARITRIHARDEILDGYRVRPEAVDLVARLGGNLWCTTRDLFELERPRTAHPDSVRSDPPLPRAPRPSLLHPGQTSSGEPESR